MGKIFSNFVKWFIVFGLSFLVSSWEWTEQGKAFLYIHLGIVAVVVLLVICCCLIGGYNGFEKIGLTTIAAIITAVAAAGVLFATWGATKLFDVDFYVAYQIMTFGQCLCTGSSKKE